jgi:hypothetical protein
MYPYKKVPQTVEQIISAKRGIVSPWAQTPDRGLLEHLLPRGRYFFQNNPTMISKNRRRSFRRHACTHAVPVFRCTESTHTITRLVCVTFPRDSIYQSTSKCRQRGTPLDMATPPLPMMASHSQSALRRSQLGGHNKIF